MDKLLPMRATLRSFPLLFRQTSPNEAESVQPFLYGPASGGAKPKSLSEMKRQQPAAPQYGTWQKWYRGKTMQPTSFLSGTG